MKLRKYLVDKLPQIAVCGFGDVLIFMLLRAFKTEQSLIGAVLFVLLCMELIVFGIDYIRKYSFYKRLEDVVESLDKKYLALEMLDIPDFYEGRILYQSLYEIDKSMNEHVKEYQANISDFKDYVEMWIHEVKIPISSLTLLNHNHPDSLEKKYIEQIKRLDNYIDQVLYYVRSENAEKDYILKEIELSDVVKNVALKNKDDLLENMVNLEVNIGQEKVYTDGKWLEFILNQIVNNCIKYRDDEKKSFIRIMAKDKDRTIELEIFDNGIGIPEQDLSRVFDKSFTGENGRLRAKSTGMGLYIAKKLCEKLGHQIRIESEFDKFTRIVISFAKNDFYSVSK